MSIIPLRHSQCLQDTVVRSTFIKVLCCFLVLSLSKRKPHDIFHILLECSRVTITACRFGKSWGWINDGNIFVISETVKAFLKWFIALPSDVEKAFLLPRERTQMNGEEKIVSRVKLSAFWLAGLGSSTFFEHVQPEQQNSGFCAHKWLQSAGAFHQKKERKKERKKKLRLASLSLPTLPSFLSLFQSFYQCLYHSVVLPLCYFIHNTRMHSHFPRRTTLNKGRDVEGFVSGCCFPSVRLLLFKCLHRTAQGLETSLYAIVKWHTVKNITFSPFHANIAMARLLRKIC